MAFVPRPPWWITYDPFVGTGACSWIPPITRACARAAMTARLPWSRRRIGGNLAGDLRGNPSPAPPHTSGRARVRPGVMRTKPVGLQTPTGVKKFSTAPTDTPCPYVHEKNSPMGVAGTRSGQKSPALGRVRLGSPPGDLPPSVGYRRLQTAPASGQEPVQHQEVSIWQPEPRHWTTWTST